MMLKGGAEAHAATLELINAQSNKKLPPAFMDPKFAKSAQRVAHKAELLPMIATALKLKPRAHWLEAMETAGVPCAAVNDIGELAETEQMAASKLIQQLPGGPKVVGLPIAFDHVRPHSPRSAPTLGEHTDEVLGSLPK